MVGKKGLGGWLVGPDLLECPSCRSKTEVIGEKLRYTSVPGAYAVFLGDALAGAVPLGQVENSAGRARAALKRQDELRRGELKPVEPATKLRPTETCYYTVPSVLLEEQRTRQGQAYWVEKNSGPLTVTEDNLYVGDQAIPINKIHGAALLGNAVHIDRSDRKRHNRIRFPDGGTAYFATLAMSRLVGTLKAPVLEMQPFTQKKSGVKLSVPIGKGKRTRVSLWAIPVALASLAVMCPCVAAVFLDGGDAADVKPTQTVVVAAVQEPADRETSTAAAELGATATPRVVEAAVVVEPTATETEPPTATPIATATRKPTASPSPRPSPTSEPANCWNAAYVADVTIPDGTWIEPGTSFEKTWRVRNAGECAWEDVTLVVSSGDDFGSQEIDVPDLAPGETGEITTRLVAPTSEGQEKSVWTYSRAGVTFGTLTMLVNVGTKPTPVPPTPVPAPPTATAAPVAVEPTAAPPAAPGEVVISYINYDGVVYRVESDEYAVIRNNGGSAVNLGGWRLNAGDPGQDFGFPGIDLGPGQECRVYTNEYHPESCGFNFGSGKAIWNNGGDCGHLYDNTGAEVSTYCY